MWLRQLRGEDGSFINSAYRVCPVTIWKTRFVDVRVTFWNICRDRGRDGSIIEHPGQLAVSREGRGTNR